MTRYGVSVFGIYPGPIDTDMADGLNHEKETPANIEQGIEDITTDGFADNFVKNFRLDPKMVEKDIEDFVD